MGKKDRKKIVNNSSSDTNEIYQMIKIFIGVLLVFFTVYLAYAILNGEIFSDKEEEKEVVEFQNIEILAGSTFEVDQKEYMVFYVDFESNDAGVVDVIYNNYVSNGDIRSYKVDMGNKFNESYAVSNKDEVNKKPKKAEDLKIYGPTLIRIKDGKVVNYISGVEKIREYLDDILED